MEHFGDYILLERVSSGGMAHIYKAAKLGSSGFFKLLAVKRIKEKGALDVGFQKMFIKEAHVQASFSHPNVVNIFDFGKEKGNYFIAMEYLNGVPLRTLLQMLRFRHERLKLEQTLYIIDSLLKGLDYIHNLVSPDGTSMTIIHRDIDPQNVFLTYSGEVKLIDFGIAGDEAETEKNEAELLKGKFSYFAPELLNGQKADQRSDLFSAGLLLYELLTLHKLFAAETGKQVLENIMSLDINEKVSRLSVDDDLKRILNRALAREPEQRYPAAAEFRDDLEHYQQNHQERRGATSFSSLMDHLFQKEQQEELTKNQFYFSILKDRDLADEDHTSIIDPADLQREISDEPVKEADEPVVVAPEEPAPQVAEEEGAEAKAKAEAEVGGEDVVQSPFWKNRLFLPLLIVSVCALIAIGLLLLNSSVRKPPVVIATEEAREPVQATTPVAAADSSAEEKEQEPEPEVIEPGDQPVEENVELVEEPVRIDPVVEEPPHQITPEVIEPVEQPVTPVPVVSEQDNDAVDAPPAEVAESEPIETVAATPQSSVSLESDEPVEQPEPAVAETGAIDNDPTDEIPQQLLQAEQIDSTTDDPHNQVQPLIIEQNDQPATPETAVSELDNDLVEDTREQVLVPERIESLLGDPPARIPAEPVEQVEQSDPAEPEGLELAVQIEDNDVSSEIIDVPVELTPEEKEPEVIQARIEVLGEPEGQLVFLNGIELGELPISILAGPGFHTIECRKEGYWSHKVRVRAIDEQSVTVECKLLQKNNDKEGGNQAAGESVQ